MCWSFGEAWDIKQTKIYKYTTWKYKMFSITLKLQMKRRKHLKRFFGPTLLENSWSKSRIWFQVPPDGGEPTVEGNPAPWHCDGSEGIL